MECNSARVSLTGLQEVTPLHADSSDKEYKAVIFTHSCSYQQIKLTVIIAVFAGVVLLLIIQINCADEA